MKIIIAIAAIAALVLVFLTVLACCNVSGKCSIVEEQEHPCDTCVRWSECNGVDEDCPKRR